MVQEAEQPMLMYVRKAITEAGQSSRASVRGQAGQSRRYSVNGSGPFCI